MIRNLRGIASATPQTLAAALYQEAEATMGDSKENYVPVRDGVLKASGIVTGPEIQGRTISATLSYGGPASDYALEQHENLSFRHKVGGPKYLERPVLARSQTFTANIAKRVRAMLQRFQG